MAPGRSDLGRLAILAIAALLLLAGCGGGSSSSAPTGGGSTESSSSADTGAEEAAGTSAEEGGSDGGKSKQGHAPVEVPEGPAEEGPSKSQKAQVPTANVELEVPSAPATPGASGALPAANTCPGKSPEITWKSIPEGTSELQLYVMNLAPVNGKLYFDYALAGIDPSLEGLKAGEVPGGAVVGRNSAGQTEYSLCPPGSEAESIVFALYAVPKSLSPKSGFEPLAMRKQAIDASESVGLYVVSASGR